MIVVSYRRTLEYEWPRLIFVDTFDGQIIKDVHIGHFHDVNCVHRDVTYGEKITFYRTAAKGCGFIKRGFIKGERLNYSGTEFTAGFNDREMKERVHPKGTYEVVECEVVGTKLIKHGLDNKPMALDVWKVTIAQYTESDYRYHPEEDEFYDELAEQGITLNPMSEEQWYKFRKEDLINLIATQLGYKVLNIINI